MRDSVHEHRYFRLIGVIGGMATATTIFVLYAGHEIVEFSPSLFWCAFGVLVAAWSAVEWIATVRFRAAPRRALRELTIGSRVRLALVHRVHRLLGFVGGATVATTLFIFSASDNPTWFDVRPLLIAAPLLVPCWLCLEATPTVFRVARQVTTHMPRQRAAAAHVLRLVSGQRVQRLLGIVVGAAVAATVFVTSAGDDFSAFDASRLLTPLAALLFGWLALELTSKLPARRVSAKD